MEYNKIIMSLIRCFYDGIYLIPKPHIEVKLEYFLDHHDIKYHGLRR